MELSERKMDLSEFSSVNDDMEPRRIKSVFFPINLVLPSVILLFSVIALFSGNFLQKSTKTIYHHAEIRGKEIKNAGKYNILSSNDLSNKIKDTVYTDKECWLELKINEQMLYQHWRNGTTVKYPVSTGNNKGGDPEALESRPGLFAIFQKVEHHKSSQFNASNMYHFMPFNQGIGFHSIDGTGYYAHLGVRPSSHGCIRMKHEDAKKLFEQCPTGTLVLATRGYSARTIAFSEDDYKNEREYSKEEYKIMLASNLFNLLNGNYYTEEREKFIIDTKVIPVSGVYTGYDVQIPDKQKIPRSFIAYFGKADKLNLKDKKPVLMEGNSEEFIELVSIDENNQNFENLKKPFVNSTADLVKKYFNNPIGVLPYFGPKR